MAGSKTVNQLPVLRDVSDDVTVLVSADNGTFQASIKSITESIEKSFGFVKKPLVKCRHCGQWGAVYCACAHCGAPIDPPS